MTFREWLQSDYGARMWLAPVVVIVLAVLWVMAIGGRWPMILKGYGALYLVAGGLGLLLLVVFMAGRESND